jgi:hypothetical protein
MKTLLLLAIVVASAIVSDASFCGESSIPFSFEALPNGQPVLGCARPVCFGYGADGRPLNSKPASFYRIYNRPDGYVRKALPNASPKPIPFGIDFQPQIARCTDVFENKQCAADNQWVGGIAPSLNLGNPIGLQCCEYELLRESKDRGVAVVRPNQVVYGGEVLNGDRLQAFDYISNIVRYVNHQDQSVYYEVSMRRMPCLDRPENGTASVDQQVGDELVNRFDQPLQQKKYPFESLKPQKDFNKSGGYQQPRALQAATYNAEQPIPAPHQPARAYSAGGHAQAAGGAPASLEVEIENVEPNSVQLVQHHQPIYQPAGGCAVGSAGCSGPAPAPVSYGSSGYSSAACYLPQSIAPSYCQQSSYGYGGGGGNGGCGCCGQPACTCCGGGGGSGFTACFSGDTMVQMANGGEKRMDELAIGDWVLSASRDNGMVYSRVDSWMHRVPDEEREFVQLHLDDGKVLKLTRGHFIYRADCIGNRVQQQSYADIFRQAPILAKDVKEGDCMFAVDETDPTEGLYERRVERIEIVKQDGFYAPLTGNGNIIVQGILSSCYNEIDHDVLQHTAFGALRPIQEFFSSLFSSEHDANKVELPIGMEMLMTHIMPYVVPTKAVGV